MVVTLSSPYNPTIWLLLVIKIAIEYNRIMKINYGTKMKDTDFRKLCAELAEKGFLITHSHNVAEKSEYGFVETEKSKTVYDIVDDGTHIMSVEWRREARDICAGFKNLIPNIDFSMVQTTTTKKVWAEPDGETVVYTRDTDGDKNNLDWYGINNMSYSDNVTMRTRVINSYSGLLLKFEVKWPCTTIQRKEKIEEMMVQEVLADMGTLQSVFEGRLKLKKYGFDINDVEIDCHFDAKTENRSECTPDIVKQVRDARKGNSV